MTESPLVATLMTTLFFTVTAGFMIRAILRPNREPASRLAWIVVILVVPVFGCIAYLLLGETSIGRRRYLRWHKVLTQLQELSAAPGAEQKNIQPQIPPDYAHLFRVGYSVNGFDPVGGNSATLLADSNATIDAMVADIDKATAHVHLSFYIWLPDNNGLKVVEALKRAAARQVACRVMIDAVGSSILLRSEHWQAMREAGIHVATALPIGKLLLRPLRGRIDLRNHRKIAVIDNYITYCGSQNCADPEFLIKAKYAPWVDAMMRFEGPIARQNQHLFIREWMSQVEDDISDLLRQPLTNAAPGFTAQVIGTGPTIRYSAMPEVFEMLIYAARRELCITTPYFVPNEAMQAALCTSARSGVATTLVFPARNDSWIVAAASRSYYAELLAAGVRLFEYHGGLLHTKSLTLDGVVTLIGSANMDRRSFELNYENNILLVDATLTNEMHQRQQQYLQHAVEITAEIVAKWPLRLRLLNNTIAMLGPVL